MAPEKKAAKKGGRRKKAVEPRGLAASEVVGGSVESIDELTAGILTDGGAVIGAYREPLGSMWQVIAALPIEKVSPTPYQRDLSPAHVTRLSKAIDKLGRFMDPIVAVRTPDGLYWTPNGSHRLAAMRALGARSIMALVVPEAEVAHRILVLNTEKAHNVRERAFEVIRLAEDLAQLDDGLESSYETEFEEPSLLTLGCCYQVNSRFSGGAYQPVLKRVESFMALKLSRALEVRRERATQLLELDAAVAEAVAALKKRGFESPYLKAFVLARINPLRWDKSEKKPPFDATIAKMLAAVAKFDVNKIRADQVARSGGPPDDS
ncbi:MAG TPA: ParB N-terminal domain-containing protein [Gemmatimonadales bacterium]|nr:ParB N-terminal domain-containing protein [Gemmatimonadales bacterium]